MSSGAGDVRVSGARAGQVAVDTGAGDVSVSATEPVGELTVRTDAGEVLVELPADGSAYAVRAGTDAGDVSIGVPEDPSSPRVVDLESDAGDITVRTAG
nr:DUF4097 family beta strand repeat-containing protein [Modestobacter versicolor]